MVGQDRESIFAGTQRTESFYEKEDKFAQSIEGSLELEVRLPDYL